MRRLVSGMNVKLKKGKVKRKKKKYDRFNKKLSARASSKVKFKTGMDRLIYQADSQRVEKRMWRAATELEEAKKEHARAVEAHNKLPPRRGPLTWLRLKRA